MSNSRSRTRQAEEGRYRLFMYLSPERLARPDTIPWLKRMPVSLFAIDEAHCISEWGHEFRPDYRQLSSLRAHFPDLPIAAFTRQRYAPGQRDDIIEASFACAIRTSTLPAFTAPICGMPIRECDARTQPALSWSTPCATMLAAMAIVLCAHH